MRMKKQLSRLVLAAFLSVLAWSCNQKDPVAKGDYVQGVFVTTIGNFFDNNGGLSYFRREHNTAESDLFAKVNGSDLKGGVAAYTTTGERGLILVDNSNAGQDKVQIVDANSFEQIAAIGTPDIENPRDVVASGNKAYVSCWGTNSDYTYRTGYIAVIDLSTNKVTKKISIGNGPQDLVIHNGKLFIGTAAFGGGRTLTVMNTASDEIVNGS
jgi:YVTN family beta-propeller protein